MLKKLKLNSSMNTYMALVGAERARSLGRQPAAAGDRPGLLAVGLHTSGESTLNMGCGLLPHISNLFTLPWGLRILTGPFVWLPIRFSVQTLPQILPFRWAQ